MKKVFKNSLTQLGIALLVAIIVVSIAPLAPANSIARAQDDGDKKSPAALCEEALPTIEEPATRTFSEPEQVLEDGVDYKAIFCTEIGAVYIDLLEDFTPVTVNNFVFLAQNGYYNSTTFHRVLPDFMVQGGDPTATGSGGPGYNFEDEFLPFLSFSTPGWLAMANAGPATNGSQFFITRAPVTYLDGRHTIFGRVLTGQDVVDTMPNRDPQNPDDAASPGSTLNTVLIVTDDSVDADIQPLEVFTPEQIVETLSVVPVEGFTIDEERTGFDSAEFDPYGTAGISTAYWAINECPAEPDLYAIGVTVVGWDSIETAASAQADSDFVASTFADTMTPIADEANITEGLLFKSASSLCETPSTEVRYIWTRGPYTLVLDFVLGDGVVPEESLPVVAINLSVAFERYVGDAIFNALSQ